MSGTPEGFDVIVLGGGAAGLMCALTAGRRGRRVLVLEHTGEVGAKILISGGGRCNFTNRDIAPERFLSGNPQFCTSALKRYTAADFVALIDGHGIAWHEKTLGQLFCDGSARQVVAMLLAECAAGHVEVRVAQTITEISRANGFRVATGRGDVSAPTLVLATGGLSIPKMGATGFSHDVARRFGLRVTETRPGLVPFKIAALAADAAPGLAGVSLPAIASVGTRRFREAILVTHRGLSGPAILQISSYWRPGETLSLDLLPGSDAAAWLVERKRARPRASLQTVLAEALPARLAQRLAAAHLPASEMANIADRTLAALAHSLQHWQPRPEATEGYGKAEVTVGGVDTRDLSSKTMGARDVPGLFVIGEAVDVTGWLGGYNFQWAWSSGWSAGQSV